MTNFKKLTKELVDFISASPSCYHVINNFRKTLLSNGFVELYENDYWDLIEGHKYFVVRADSSLIAFSIPNGDAENYQIIASHSDSPSFKIKENAEILRDGSYVELNVEKYGGMLCAPWFDRPLSVAGRAVIEEDGCLETKLVNFDRDLVMLPSLAIHMNRKANEGTAYSVQSDMLPVFGDEKSKDSFNKLLAKELGVNPSQILGKDLFLYDRSRPSFWGANGEYFSSPKLDDLQCAYSSIKALCSAGNANSITMCCVFDNEEVGSSTKQGANSTFLSDVLERIGSCLNYRREKQLMMLSESFMLSADNAHAVHPNHMDKADLTNHPHMNCGVVIKYNSEQRYTTDAVSGAIFSAICKKEKIPVQTFVNNSDVPGGSTLGNISNSHISLNTVDIGAPQLAMHSPYETGGIKDTYYLEKSMEAFYKTHIHRTRYPDYSINFAPVSGINSWSLS